MPSSFFQQPQLQYSPALEPPGWNLLRDQMMRKIFGLQGDPYNYDPSMGVPQSALLSNTGRGLFNPITGGYGGGYGSGMGSLQGVNGGASSPGGGQLGDLLRQVIQVAQARKMGGGTSMVPMRGAMGSPPMNPSTQYRPLGRDGQCYDGRHLGYDQFGPIAVGGAGGYWTSTPGGQGYSGFVPWGSTDPNNHQFAGGGTPATPRGTGELTGNSPTGIWSPAQPAGWESGRRGWQGYDGMPAVRAGSLPGGRSGGGYPPVAMGGDGAGRSTAGMRRPLGTDGPPYTFQRGPMGPLGMDGDKAVGVHGGIYSWPGSGGEGAFEPWSELLSPVAAPSITDMAVGAGGGGGAAGGFGGGRRRGRRGWQVDDRQAA